MNYRVIGLMSGSSLDGLDIAYVHLEETAGRWTFDIKHSACIPYKDEWVSRLTRATELSAREYLLLDADYGHLLGRLVRDFMTEKELAYQVQFISSHGHTVFHMPERKMTAQLGDGAAIAAEAGLAVISDLRSMDVARGGQGAPIVPVGEKLLFPEISLFLNLGGIANISAAEPERVGFDVCPANRVLNALASGLPRGFDENGITAASGRVDGRLLTALNHLDYYQHTFPKSLANDFGVEMVLPMIREAGLGQADALRTYVEHIVQQITASATALKELKESSTALKELKESATALKEENSAPVKMLVTGGGAHNTFLISRLRDSLEDRGVEIEIPADGIVDFKEALVMALMGVLRWREEANVFASVTGASTDSINGALFVP